MAEAKKVNFSAELKELEAIVESFESGEIDLDAAIPKFERGMELASQLKQYLETVQNEINVIKKRFDAPSKSEADN